MRQDNWTTGPRDYGTTEAELSAKGKGRSRLQGAWSIAASNGKGDKANTGYVYRTAMSHSEILPPTSTRHLARLTFVAFLFTFIASRIVVILIMSRQLPDLFLHIGGTHVHHLNYGIFLLSAVAGVLLFARLNDKQRSVCALAYGFSMALTFDEFGMWLHLGGSYWQRASFDAVIVLLGVFGVLAFLPQWQRIRTRHYVVGGALLVSVAVFYPLLFRSLKHADEKLTPRLLELEQKGPR